MCDRDGQLATTQAWKRYDLERRSNVRMGLLRRPLVASERARSLSSTASSSRPACHRYDLRVAAPRPAIDDGALARGPANDHAQPPRLCGAPL